MPGIAATLLIKEFKLDKASQPEAWPDESPRRKFIIIEPWLKLVIVKEQVVDEPQNAFLRGPSNSFFSSMDFALLGSFNSGSKSLSSLTLPAICLSRDTARNEKNIIKH